MRNTRPSVLRLGAVSVAAMVCVLAATPAFASVRAPAYSRYAWSSPRVALSGSRVTLSGAFLTDGPHAKLRLQLQQMRSGRWASVSSVGTNAWRSGSGQMQVSINGDGSANYATVPRYRYAAALSAQSHGRYRLRAVLTFQEGDEGYFWTARTSSNWKYFSR